ncbi:MAG: hypothetical protein H6Q90_4401 [Deltaproteobacteria bacterium]|nr:hypothetical protein [Deltaproteobacteria bacterium]
MKLFISLLFALAPTVALADVSYNSETNVTHDCAKDPDVSVNSSNGTFVFTGTCDKISINGSTIKATIESISKLSINGAGNTIDITAVDKLSVNGSSNTVTYKKALTGKKPKISKLGTGNKITKVK